MDQRLTGNDECIVMGCLANDPKAWAELTRKYSSLINSAARKRLAKYGFTLPCHDIDEINQETLVDIWTGGKLKSVKNKSNISFWLAIVAGNRAMAYLRRKRASQPDSLIPLSTRIDEAELSDIIPAPMYDDDESEREDIHAKVLSAINSLTCKEKLVAKLSFIHKKSYHEISDMTGMPMGTVASYIMRAKEKIKDFLQ